LISVIVPVYNSGRYLERVIGALLAQDYPREARELIFVDNGSNDDGREILARYSEIRVLVAPERGSYAARNLGLREARGDTLAFVDSDCYPLTGWLRSIDRGFATSSAQVLLGPRLPAVDTSWLRLIAEYENRKTELVCASKDPLVYFGHTNNMAVRRATMDRFGPFVQRARGADTIFVRRVVDALSCDAVAYCPDMGVRHAELDSVATYYRKMGIYGGSRKAYRHITAVRALNQKERLSAFREATRRRGFLDMLQLFALLVGGSIAWWYGGLGVERSDA
jgi:glycosyltransferase involved in cell wall biosynthesis